MNRSHIMKRHIESADLVRYNANIRGKNVGDCVKRSLSLAFNMDYGQLEKELQKAAHKVYRTPPENAYRQSIVYNEVIYAHGGSKPKEVDETIKLGDFIDNELPDKGTFLITTGRTTGHSDHIVCVIDKKLYDSWDSRDQYVFKYYTISSDSSGRAAGVDKKDLLVYALKDNHLSSRIKAKAEGMLAKKGYEGQVTITDTLKRDYKITTYVEVTFPAFGGQSKEREYEFEVATVFTPFSTEEDIAKLIDKAVNVRTYDRVYAILQNEKEYRESMEMLGDESNKVDQSRFWLTSNEARIFRKLPAWVQARATYFNVQSPGQYYDSYELYIKALPSDPYRSPSDTVMFEAYDMTGLRRQLDEYKETYKYIPDSEY